MKKKFITTPIYYINDVPHVGHAYTTIAADVLSRYYQDKNEEVFLLTGVDEHGAKIAEAAKKVGKEPKEFVDGLVPRFKESWEKLNIKYSEFFRTTDLKHQEIVVDLILKLKERGFIEKRKYSGMYCTACEKYLLPDELIDGSCPDHGTQPEEHSEENYFFLLSKLTDKLLSAIDAGDYQILPESRKNEVIGKIRSGLEDVSISREKVEWGIPFPGDTDQTIYVWIDALVNYYSATKIYDQKNIWPPDVHLMAKDILWFHAVIWPAILIVLDLPLPKKIFAHGFFTVGGQKMSKTRGNVLDPNKLVDKFGTDAVRYCLLREFPFGEDGDFSEEKIALRYQSELSNGLGNLVQRTISMINRYNVEVKGQKLGVGSQRSEFSNLIEELKFDQALLEVNNQVAKLNQYIEENRPWELAKSDEKKLAEVLLHVYKTLNFLSSDIAPFMPETAEKMKHQLETLVPEPLFPRIN